MADIVISLDLSFHCSGIAVLDHINKEVHIGILPSIQYGFDMNTKPKMLKSNINAQKIKEHLVRALYKYRHFDVEIIYECIPYGFKRGKTNSDLDLHGMQTHVSNSIAEIFHKVPFPIVPKAHKKMGKNQEAVKPEFDWIHGVLNHYPFPKWSAIISLLNRYPFVVHWFKKLDDVADAFAMLDMAHHHCFPSYTIKKLII